MRQSTSTTRPGVPQRLVARRGAQRWWLGAPLAPAGVGSLASDATALQPCSMSAASGRSSSSLGDSRKRPRAQDDAGGNGENFEEDTQALITATLDKQKQASAWSQTHDYIYFASTQPSPFFSRRLKLRRCGRRLRSLRRPQHGSLRPRRLLAALLPGRSNRGCDSRQRSRLRRGRSRRRTRCTRTPRPGRSSAASSSISSLGAACPTKS